MSRTPTFALGTIRSYTRREGNSTTYTRNAVYTLYRKFSRSKKIGLETFLRLKKKRYYHTRHVFENRKKVLNGTLKKKKREKKNYFKSFETRFQNIFQFLLQSEIVYLILCIKYSVYFIFQFILLL